MIKQMLVAASVAAIVVGANAQTFTLTDGNSSLELRPASASTQRVWRVNNGPDNVFRGDYYFRVGATAEALINTVGPGTFTQIGSNTLVTSWVGPLFTIDVTWMLRGGQPGSLVSDITEVVRINNTSGQPLPISLFRYADYDLLFDQRVVDDRAEMVNSSTVRQWDSRAELYYGTVLPPTAWEIDYGIPPSGPIFPLLSKLTDNLPTTLGSTPVIGTPFPAQPGDVSFAFQWDTVIAPRGSYLMSSNTLLVVPEPGAIASLGVGLAALLGARLRRR